MLVLSRVPMTRHELVPCLLCICLSTTIQILHVPFYGIYITAQEINIISIEQ